MDKEVNSVSDEDKNVTGLIIEEKSSSSEVKSKPRVKPKVISSIRRTKSKKAMSPELRVAIWVAIIGAIATVATALFNFPPFIDWVQSSSLPTLTPISTSSPTSFITETPIPSFTAALTPMVLPSITNAPTISVTPTDIPASATPAAKMEVYVYADRATGKAPLKVKFDARDSYLRESNGIHFPCRGGACFYTWKVYSNGQQIGRSENNSSGTFEYSFGRNGAYLVTVWICRGRDKIDCGGGGIQIAAAR